MPPSVLTQPIEQAGAEQMLRPAPLADGSEPEQRIVHSGIAWGQYLAFDKKLGDDRPDPRLYYLDGELEIMSTSDEHERVKEWLGGFMEDYFLEEGIETVPRGQATMRLALKAAGAEPDKSWCLHREKKFPDLVLEVALTSGGVNKLEVYRRFKIPEVWFWRRNTLQIFVLAGSGRYEPSPTSQLLPGLDLGLLGRCLAIRSWQQARRTFRGALKRKA